MNVSAKILTVSLLLAVAACGQSVPNPSGTYDFKDGNTDMTYKISPLKDQQNKYSFEILIDGKHFGTGVVVYNKESKKFCLENNRLCFDYDSKKGIRPDNKPEFIKGR